jgi:hypothetical protein
VFRRCRGDFGCQPLLPILMTTGYNEDLVADIPRGTQLDVVGKPYRKGS